MQEIIYIGIHDTRELGEVDFDRMGVERKHAITFRRGVSQEVSDEVAHGLMNHPLVIGEFVQLLEEDLPSNKGADQIIGSSEEVPTDATRKTRARRSANSDGEDPS